MSDRPRASLIVPAFNEERRIGPLLPTLRRAVRDLGYRVVVACNGCTDRTVEMATATDGLEVLVLERASKPYALNEAERALGDVFPRLYVDADVRTDLASLEALVEALRVDEPRAVRPLEDYEWSRAPWVPRAFYEARYVVPSSRAWLESHLEGHHIYGTNAAGRAKFEAFPEDGQIMEDAFFDRMFDEGEKVVVRDAHVLVPLPSTRALLRGLVRIYQGNWQLDEWLATNRPDRVGAGVSSPTRPAGLLARLRSLAPGGPTIPSWRPRVLAVTLTSVVVRRVAVRRARRLVAAGRQSSWR